MFGMLIATGLAMEHFIALIAAVIIFGVGMVIRVRSEEKLLRDAFGQEFDDYARARACGVAGDLLSLHQMVATAPDLRISRSAVIKGMSSIREVAAIRRSTGSFG